MLAHLRSSHEEDAKILIAPRDLAAWLKTDATVRLLDIRSREEFEAVHLPGSVLMAQPVMREILAEGTNARPLVIVDHQGRQALDAAAYFLGHGLERPLPARRHRRLVAKKSTPPSAATRWGRGRGPAL